MARVDVLKITKMNDKLFLRFSGKLTLYDVPSCEEMITRLDFNQFKSIVIDLENLTYLDTIGSIFLNQLKKDIKKTKNSLNILVKNKDIIDTLQLTDKSYPPIKNKATQSALSIFAKFGKSSYELYKGFFSFIAFFGRLFSAKFFLLQSMKNIRYKEIAFEIKESGINALWIIALTNFLIGLVVAYQSAYQLKVYGANIFIVDMLGISIMRELAPLVTAIVIAGRSGSSFTAQIGAMKITQELDAMKTMGFDPCLFLVMPRIIALMVVLPLLIFVADMMGILGGMIVANIDLNISTTLFLERFNEVVSAKHFFLGLFKGPFFAFLIASIGIYRGFHVKNDTQSIGFSTTKSVVASIFAVIVCDAVFSIIFTKLGF